MKDDKLCQYKMTEEEVQECKEIIEIIRGCGLNERLEYGNPIYQCGTYDDGSPRYLAGGDCYDSMMAIKRQEGYGFNYYIVEVGDRGFFSIFDFNSNADQSSKEGALRQREHLLQYLLSTQLRRCDSDAEEEYIIFNHYCVKAIPVPNEYYRFEMTHSYGSKIENDKVFEEVCSCGEPVFIKKYCDACYTSWFFNAKYLKEGKKCVCECPKCKAHLG